MASCPSPPSPNANLNNPTTNSMAITEDVVTEDDNDAVQTTYQPQFASISAVCYDKLEVTDNRPTTTSESISRRKRELGLNVDCDNPSDVRMRNISIDAPSSLNVAPVVVETLLQQQPLTTPSVSSSSTRSGVSPPVVKSLELHHNHSETVSRQQQTDVIGDGGNNTGTPTTTPTAAIMRTPPSPRSTVILPLPRVTVTSPSDLSPHNTNTTSTSLITESSEDTTVSTSPPSPLSPTSPPIPRALPPRSVVIVPFPTATAFGLTAMEPASLDTFNLPPPPPYEGLIKDDDDGENRSPDSYGLNHMDALPSYAVATDLPTYEEAEIAKANEMLENRDRAHAGNSPTTHQQQAPPPGGMAGQQHMSYPEDERVPAYDPYHLTGVSLGTDWIFLCTFAISFLFNWLGFLISLCITNTVAGRCGALSGLGLSMVKWVVIMKHNTMAQGFMQGDSWVWWILMICGFLLFLRGCIQYVNMKYEWKRIFVRLQQMYFS